MKVLVNLFLAFLVVTGCSESERASIGSKLAEATKSQQEKQRDRVVARINQSIEDDIREQYATWARQEDIEYSKIVVIGYGSPMESKNGYKVSVKFDVEKDALLAKAIANYQGKFYYTNQGEYSGSEWQTIGKNVDLSNLKKMFGN